jgi:hypothetical protein
LPPPVAAHDAQKFIEAGVIVLKDLLSPDRVATINKAYATQFGELTHQSAAAYIKEVGDRRLMVALEVAGAFAAPDILRTPSSSASSTNYSVVISFLAAMSPSRRWPAPRHSVCTPINKGCSTIWRSIQPSRPIASR